MSNPNFTNVTPTVNGDNVIRFTNTKAFKAGGYVDKATYMGSLLAEEDGHKHYLGLIETFETTQKIAVPFLRDLLRGSRVLEIEPGSTITYDIALEDEDFHTKTAVDTSDLYEKPGIDGGYFEIILTDEFKPGDYLTSNLQYGQQIIVSSNHEVVLDGENFLHTVQLVSQDKEAYYKASLLKPDICYYKVSNVIGEFDVDYSGVNTQLGGTRMIQNEFELGDPRGVEIAWTKKANVKSDKLAELTSKHMDHIRQKLTMYGNNDMFVLGQMGANGGIKNAKVGTLLEYLAFAELAKMEAYGICFAQGGTLQSAQGVKRINEGVWPQIRRGKRITYSRPGGITLNEIMEAASYVVKNSTAPDSEREIMFEGGAGAIQNLHRIFSEYALTAEAAIGNNFFGTDAQVNGKLFTGNLDDLAMQLVRISSVVLPGIGRVRAKHNPTMDYDMHNDRRSQGFYGAGGYAHTSYSLTIYDAADPMYAKVDDVKNAKLVKNGDRNANIYLVKNAGPAVTYGYEAGRMELGDNYSRLMASNKTMSTGFWAHSQSAGLVLDVTRYVTIELENLEQR